MQRNINNIFETRPIQVQEAISREPIILFKSLTKARDYLKLISSKMANPVDRIIFSSKLNRNVILKDYKEKWQSKQAMVVLKKETKPE